MRGILNRPTAHGEGCVKRFLDTGSTPVSSTKKQYPARKCRGTAFFFGGTDEELNPFPRLTSVQNFCLALAEGETLPLCSANASRLLRVARQISGARLCSLFASAGFKLPSGRLFYTFLRNDSIPSMTDSIPDKSGFHAATSCGLFKRTSRREFEERFPYGIGTTERTLSANLPAFARRRWERCRRIF